MGLEAATFIQSLDASNPLAGDRKNQGDDHLRLVKAVLKATFPNSSKALYFPGVTSFGVNRAVIAAEDHQHLLGDSSSGAITVTLPALVGGDAGWEVTVYKGNTSANPVFVTAAGGITTYQFSVPKIRCDVPWVGHKFLWTGLGYAHLPIGVNHPGRIELHAGGGPPVGYAVAQGQSLLRDDHPELFGWWATLYGTVDGAHFNAPDLRDRFPVGAGSSYGVGATGGEVTHVLSLAETPSHFHTNNANSNGPSTNNATVPISTQVMAPPGGGTPVTLMVSGGSTNVNMQNHTHLINNNTDSKGSDGGHENRPPFFALFPVFRLC